jgi:hypothetical protein
MASTSMFSGCLFASENEGGDGDDSKNNIAGRVDQSEDL